MISVIIPTYNEEDCIISTIRQLLLHDEAKLVSEVIVADGGSTDNTLVNAGSNASKLLRCPEKGRANQMNFGAAHATGDVLYFLHADTIPPPGFTSAIKNSIDNNHQAGCFTLTFNHRHWFLQANCWFTRFDVNAFRFGDQSLFVTHELFRRLGGFDTSHIVLEDQEFIKRLRKICAFTIIRNPVTTSARKYLEHGVFKTQAVFFLIYIMYRLGFSQQHLLNTYRSLIKQNKL